MLATRNQPHNPLPQPGPLVQPRTACAPITPPHSSKAADCDDEAEERADALMRAGVVLRLNSVVYLRPSEIAEAVYRVSFCVAASRCAVKRI